MVTRTRKPMEWSTAVDIAHAVDEARSRHGCLSASRLMAAAMEELGETSRTLFDGNLEAARDGALHVAAVMVRLVEEHIDAGEVDRVDERSETKR